MLRLFSIAFLISVMTGLYPAFAQAPTPAPAEVERRARPAPPTRDPHTPGYVAAKELPDGAKLDFAQAAFLHLATVLPLSSTYSQPILDPALLAAVSGQNRGDHV